MVVELKVDFAAKSKWTGNPIDVKKLAGAQVPAVAVDDVVAVCFTDAKSGEKFWRRGTVAQQTQASKKHGMVRVQFPDKSSCEQFPADFFFRMHKEHNWRFTT